MRVYFHVDIQWFLHHLLKRLFSYWITLPPLLKIHCPYMCASTSVLLLCSIDVYILIPMPHHHNYCSFITKSWNQSIFSNFILFQNCFGYPRTSDFHINFRTSLSISTRKCTGNLVDSASNLYIHLMRIHG